MFYLVLRFLTGLFGHIQSLAYLWLSLFIADVSLENKSWKKLWHLHCSQKIKLFLWLLSHKNLLVRAHLSNIGLAINPDCPSCRVQDETLDHLFVNCHVTVQVSGMDENSGLLEYYFPS